MFNEFFMEAFYWFVGLFSLSLIPSVFYDDGYTFLEKIGWSAFFAFIEAFVAHVL